MNVQCLSLKTQMSKYSQSYAKARNVFLVMLFGQGRFSNNSIRLAGKSVVEKAMLFLGRRSFPFFAYSVFAE
jgi:hypothetical protein